jgi:hypothetical protein
MYMGFGVVPVAVLTPTAFFVPLLPAAKLKFRVYTLLQFAPPVHAPEPSLDANT